MEVDLDPLLKSLVTGVTSTTSDRTPPSDALDRLLTKRFDSDVPTDAWERSHTVLGKSVPTFNRWLVPTAGAEESRSDGFFLKGVSSEQRQAMLKDYGARHGSVSERLYSLLEQMRAFFTPDEARQAEKAAKALDVTAFCVLAEAALARAR